MEKLPPRPNAQAWSAKSQIAYFLRSPCRLRDDCLDESHRELGGYATKARDLLNAKPGHSVVPGLSRLRVVAGQMSQAFFEVDFSKGTTS